MRYKKILLAVVIGFILPMPIFAAYDSQCQTGRDSGPQNGCTHENDQRILQQQCTGRYGASSCENMSSYLNAMTVDCQNSRNSSVDCSTISQNGIYGREASRFANYQENAPSNERQNSNSNNSGQGWTSSLGFIRSIGLPKSSVSSIILNIMYWLLFMLGVVGVIGFVIAGIMYLLAAGDENLISRAKKAMTFSIIGVIVGLAGLVIIQAVINMLSESPII